MIGASDLVLDAAFDDRCAEVVFRVDRGHHLFAEHHRLAGRIDRDLELGFLVLLDTKAAAAVVHDEKLIHAQRGVGRQFKLAIKAAVGVGRKTLGQDRFTLWDCESQP